MSYNPNQNYGYATVPNYYVDDTEDFMPDYTDSEGLSEHHQMLQAGHQNVTEIYSRNDLGVASQRQMLANQMGYQQNQGQYVQQYYYENPPVQQARRLTAIPVQDYGHTYDSRLHQYCPLATSSLHDTNYDTATYRSAQHDLTSAAPVATSPAPTGHPNCQRGYQEAVVQPTPASKQQAVKRYPIKVGTPKYYRKQATNAVYKRPSALCLPVASQPDPAVHKKHKKLSHDIQYGYPQNVTFTNGATDTQFLDKPSDQVVTDHKVDSEGDFNVTVSKLEDMFAQLENDSEVAKTKSKNDIVKFAKFLKPRVPPSVKARQEKVNLKTSNAETADGKSSGVEMKTPKTGEQEDETSGDSIERLLNQLKKCELAVCSDGLDKNAEKNGNQNRDNNVESNGQEKKQMPPIRTKSFNYQDITSQMTKSNSEMKSFERDIDVGHRVRDVTRRLNLSMSTSRSFVSKPPLDDHCALELHRSKSYIVNLIDRALSKELGTVPCSRIHKKEFNDMSPRKAIDTMNRHVLGGKTDKDLCLEITSALTDSIISNATAPDLQDVDPIPSSPSSSKGKVCCCNAEEPIYIKQLKQLRWGHLKHIQREVRRLEDLERFLDSCSLNPISEI